jgi:hypothetical protein
MAYEFKKDTPPFLGGIPRYEAKKKVYGLSKEQLICQLCSQALRRAKLPNQADVKKINLFPRYDTALRVE